MSLAITAAAAFSSASLTADGANSDYSTLLLLDENAVESSRGVVFSLNQPTKHEANPVLLPGDTSKWDSLQVSWPGTVLYSAEEGLFRCWYAGLDAVQSTPGRYWKTGYAESKDGIHWTKPDLGQETYLDRPTNRVVLPFAGPDFLRVVFENPDRSNPERRFGGIYLDLPTAYGICWSADGKTWTRGDTLYEYSSLRQDICQVFFDDADPDPNYRVKGYSQLQIARDWDGREGIRQIGLSHGPSVDNLQPYKDPLILRPQRGIDEELHGCSVYRIGSTYVMLFESDTFSTVPLHGDLRLAVSTDGRSFRRVHPDKPFIPTGPQGSWDENLLINTAEWIQEVGDDLYIYYFGCPNVYNNWPSAYAVSGDRRGSLFYPVYLGLATLPRDRFGYASGPGEMVTHPLRIGNRGLWVNADGSGIAVEALNFGGETVAEGRLGAKTLQTVYRNVDWTPGAPNDSVRLRFRLDGSTKLYSVRY